MENLVISFSFILALVIGLVQVAKKYMSKRWLPLLALVLGILLFFLRDYQIISKVWGQDIFLGLVVGLSSMGLWSGTKHTITG